MTALIPFLWFETQAEEAARYYVSIFPNAKLGEIQRFPAGAHGVEGSVMTASFELGGQLLVFCRDAGEAESVSVKLAAGGEREPGGWLKDRFGVSWQIAARS